MNKDIEAVLKVREADPNLVGKKIVTLDFDTKRMLKLDHGDFVSIKGKKETIAQVWPARPLDEGSQIVRIDGFTRKNAGINLDDKVVIKKVEAQRAKKIIFAPTKPVKLNGNNYERIVKKQFLGKPFVIGDEVIFSVFGSPIVLIAQKIIPKGFVKITEMTEIQLLETPTNPENGNIEKTSYEDIGGLSEQITKIREMIELPLKAPELFAKLGVEPPKGILMYGPPGTGKTMLAKAVANEADAHFILINGPSIMSKYVGGAEEKLREIFKEAQENAPAIIFIDEIDAVAPAREESGSEVERRVVGQLLSLLDGTEARGDIVIIGATNRPNSIDNALRRPGRFDREVEIAVPDKNSRREILNIHTKLMPLEKKIDLNAIVELTHGFVGADISALVKETAMQSIKRTIPLKNKEMEITPEILETIEIKQEDFINALKEVHPSAMREVFVETPAIKWDEIGGLENIKKELKKSVEWPLLHEKSFKEIGIDPIKGIMLYGPPGTGKTMLVKAIANEISANFIGIKGPELFSKWLGESEKTVRKIFSKARQTSPCIVFFDEIDAIAPKRSNLDDGSNGTTSRIVNQLLTELDGLTDLKGVVFIAATNRPNTVDTALLRAGRVDKMLYTPLPDNPSRLDILQKISKDMKIADDVKFKNLIEKTDGFSGADLAGLIREAGLICLERSGFKDPKINKDDFENALLKIKTQMETRKETELDYNYIR
jgi:transitional endoplasmic reticulum ATPase